LLHNVITKSPLKEKKNCFNQGAILVFRFLLYSVITYMPLRIKLFWLWMQRYLYHFVLVFFFLLISCGVRGNWVFLLCIEYNLNKKIGWYHCKNFERRLPGRHSRCIIAFVMVVKRVSLEDKQLNSGCAFSLPSLFPLFPPRKTR
jgi:hypothetical protein